MSQCPLPHTTTQGLQCFLLVYFQSLGTKPKFNKRLFSFLWNVFFFLILFLHVWREVFFAGLAGHWDLGHHLDLPQLANTASPRLPSDTPITHTTNLKPPLPLPHNPSTHTLAHTLPTHPPPPKKTKIVFFFFFFSFFAFWLFAPAHCLVLLVSACPPIFVLVN